MSNERRYDLEARTITFGEQTIDLCKSIRQDVISSKIIGQLVRSATSVGANYMEANGASSKKDFRNKIYICKKEAQETKYWLVMLKKCDKSKVEVITKLWKEAQELTMIFQKITTTLDKK